MSTDRIAAILDAAYRCFLRHGIRRTSMDDIAAEAGMSRPAVYQYVRNKDDVFRRLATRMLDDARQRAHAAATGHDDLAAALAAVLGAKLDLTTTLWHATPHAAELLGEGTRATADLADAFTADLRELLAGMLAASGAVDAPVSPDDLADILIALTRGLEHDLDDPHLPARRLRLATTLLVRGLTKEKTA